ncbi:tRNA (guanine(6)-N2)-methyltransferase THUMP3-like isoform X1 [Schistocerca nitens]|uniref:tRNA (guanine(6)-N2)-methyltransferase THUMP3-like isoform X1 n=1 Tax=Schistocerca nitens TaxID=7011 RepID=UPI0021179DDF|nr:tRNA (guanine(6)-N2)-methyltransferase THUMP3-like isoform X1 [Schistocerca nitens]XP_049805777.1 tRNA (guanine(6)-N2)-methyltransferase THUMP3-like isoform X1 [Schistocerca nitens]
MNIFKLMEISAAQATRCTVEATVASGLESVPASEFKNAFLAEHCTSRGRVFANVLSSQIPEVLQMRSVDNLSLVAEVTKDITFSTADKEQDLKKLEKLAYAIHWDKTLLLWKKSTDFHGILYPTRDQYVASLAVEKELKIKLESSLQESVSEIDNDQNMEKEHEVQEESQSLNNNICREKKAANILLYNQLDSRKLSEKVLKFRVTCYHTGSHAFGSQEAATAFGGTLQDIFNWVVDLTYYDLEIVLNIKEDFVYVTVPLTKESLHRRSITYFGPTTLRSTICYGMLTIASPEVGDIIIDPLCGGGSIPIEGALSFPGSLFLSGDIHPKAIERTKLNINELTAKHVSNIDVFNWDAQKLPLKDSCIDLCVTDLPFGKRMGSKKNNSTLYVRLLFELARVMKTSGRAVFLTYDKGNFVRAVSTTHGLFKMIRILTVNIGGLAARLYVIQRTAKEYQQSLPLEVKKRRKKKNKLEK